MLFRISALHFITGYCSCFLIYLAVLWSGFDALAFYSVYPFSITLRIFYFSLRFGQVGLGFEVPCRLSVLHYITIFYFSLRFGQVGLGFEVPFHLSVLHYITIFYFSLRFGQMGLGFEVPCRLSVLHFITNYVFVFLKYLNRKNARKSELY